MKNPGGHAACIARILSFVAVLAAAAALSGCGLAGRVYIAFLWTDSEIPDGPVFVCTAPNVPVQMAAIVKGRYYETVAGTYTLQYNYASDLTVRALSFVLATDATILGQENSYYHATLRKAAAPTVEPYP